MENHNANEKNTSGKPGDVNGWIRENLIIDTGDDPEFQGVSEFYIRLRMNANSYEKEHPVLSGLVNRLVINAEVQDRN